MTMAQSSDKKYKGAGFRALVLLIALLLIASLLGIWLLLYPYTAFVAEQAEQDTLMESILLVVEASALEAETASIPDGNNGMDAKSTIDNSMDHEIMTPRNETVTVTADLDPSEVKIVPETVDVETLESEEEEKTLPSTELAEAKPVTDMDISEVLVASSGYGILTIDKIELNMPVVPGVSAEQLKTSACWAMQTAHIGATGNAVIAGHRQYEYGRQFNRLGELELGDMIGFQSVEGEVMTFMVYEILVVEPGDQTAFGQPGNRAVLTLYTCTPIRIATHRLLVLAERLY
jgi:LPXTG-site transpeptidase (sortase) family protein